MLRFWPASTGTSDGVAMSIRLVSIGVFVVLCACATPRPVPNPVVGPGQAARGQQPVGDVSTDADASSADTTVHADGGAGPDRADVMDDTGDTKPVAALPGKPNILLVLVDTLRHDHMSIYGYKRKTTPRIDKFFEPGVVFEWAHATGPATRFSVPPMLYGKHYTEIQRGMGHWPKISSKEKNFGAYLQEAGYHTGAVHSIHYFRDRYNMHGGWDHWDNSCLQWRNRVKNPKWKHLPYRKCEWAYPTADYITDRTLVHADEAKLAQGQKPWLLWAYYSDPHAPYLKHKGKTPEFGGWYSDRYDREIWFADFHIGRLLDGLEKRGMLDNTIVVMTSDHGEGLSKARDHGRLLHSSTLYEELLRIPILVSGKPAVLERYGIAKRRVKTPISLLDIMPTFLEAAGMAPDKQPKYLRGVSLWPWMRRVPAGETEAQFKEPKHPPLFFEKHRAEDAPQKGMLDWPYKLIADAKSKWRYQIYNLAEDPKEKRPLRYRMPKELRQKIYERYMLWKTETLKPAKGNFLN